MSDDSNMDNVSPVDETEHSESIINSLSDIFGKDEKENVDSEETGTREDGVDNRDDEGAGEDQPAVATQDTETEETTEPLLTIKVNGEERQVKQSELIAHYQKANGAAVRFEEITAHKQAVEAERAQLAQVIEAYQSQLQNVMQATQPDWDALLESDPAEYVRQRHSYDKLQNQMHEAEQAKAYLAEQKNQELQTLRQRYEAEQLEQLYEAVPEWREPEKAKAEAGAIIQYLKNQGFGKDVLDSMIDHREWVMARKAMMYDHMMKKQSAVAQQVAKKVQKLPPTKVERSGSSGSNKQDGKSQAMRRLSESGSLDDAAAALLSMYEQN